MAQEILVVGMGPGPVGQLTREAAEVLLKEKEVYFRFSAHPVFEWLREEGKECYSFDYLYSVPGMTYNKVYKTILETLIKSAKKFGRVVYALPGNPCVFETTPRWLRDRTGEEVSVRVIPGMSFLEIMYLELEIDPEEGLQILNASGFGHYGDYPYTEKLGLLIGQIGLPSENAPSSRNKNAEAVADSLLKKFPPDHRVTLFWSEGMPDYKNVTRTFPLSELKEQTGYIEHLASLYVPPVKPPWENISKE
ncbi:MAG: SAM-dependent methyltransferase [bacterium]